MTHDEAWYRARETDRVFHARQRPPLPWFVRWLLRLFGGAR